MSVNSNMGWISNIITLLFFIFNYVSLFYFYMNSTTKQVSTLLRINFLDIERLVDKLLFYCGNVLYGHEHKKIVPPVPAFVQHRWLQCTYLKMLVSRIVSLSVYVLVEHSGHGTYFGVSYYSLESLYLSLYVSDRNLTHTTSLERPCFLWKHLNSSRNFQLEDYVLRFNLKGSLHIPKCRPKTSFQVTRGKWCRVDLGCLLWSVKENPK